MQRFAQKEFIFVSKDEKSRRCSSPFQISKRLRNMSIPQSRSAKLSVEPIWVVDDNSGVRSLLRTLLERVGFGVCEFADGWEVLDHMEQDRSAPALMISDINMPVIDGVSLARAVRSVFPQTAVLLISGAGTPPPSGPRIVFMPKPFDSGLLLAAVEGLLEPETGVRAHAA